MTTPLPRPRARRRAVVVSVVLVGLAFAAWFVAALVLFVLPQQQPLRKADAVVSLSPPRERLPVALHAVAEGWAPRLWVSYVPDDFIDDDDRDAVDAVCAGDAPADVTCFRPLTHDTIGEARAVARLIQEQPDVASIIVVTNVSHATRTRYLFERCLPRGIDVQVLLVDEPDSPLFRFGRMLYETGAFAKAIVEAPRCHG